jgi:hypothetical protein
MKPNYKLNFELLFESDSGTNTQLVKEILHYVNRELSNGANCARREFLELAEAILDHNAKNSLFSCYSHYPYGHVLLHPNTLYPPRAKILQRLKSVHNNVVYYQPVTQPYEYSVLKDVYRPSPALDRL